MFYLFCKWLHIVAIISWMAGILYLYRLFVNHAEKGLTSEDNHALLSQMEERLYRFITFPAMVVSWLAGLGMIVQSPQLAHSFWFTIKLFCVLVLTGMTQLAGRLVQRFAGRQGPFPTSKTLRILNEVPTLCMLIIVWMVIFKPF